MSRIDVALVFLRVVFGLSIVAHGANKIVGGLDGTQRWFAGIGMLYPRTQARIASGSEVVSGSLLALGFFTAPACAIIISLMIVAIVTVHWKVGYFIFLPNGGWEYCAAIASVVTAISLTGPGRWSLDHALDTPMPAGVWALPVAVIVSVIHLVTFWRPQFDSSSS